MKGQEVIALIPARGGSKSIPRKNIYPILDKPLIAWSIEQAKRADKISRVIVSTDDEEIAEISLKYGAEVPFIRPDEFSTDTATDLDVFKHAINWLRINEGYSPKLIVHLRPTGPARYINLIDEAIVKLNKNDSYDSLRSVSLSDQTPYKMWFIENNRLESIGEILGIHGSHSLPRQSLRKAYWQNGYIDIVKPSTITEMDSMTGKKILPFIINHSVRDIDYTDDIPLVETDLKKVIGNDFIQPNDIIEERYPT